MNIEDYFDLIEANDIRVKGTRVGIESILYEYVHREQSPEAIAERFPSVTLEQVYATILYYLQDRAKIETYLADWLTFGRRKRAEQAVNDHPALVRLRNLKAILCTQATG
jgi:uncharacterized protein (DUF433 family)